MTGKKNTDLKLTQVKKVSKKLNETEQFPIESGEYKGSTITFYPHFSQTKINKLLEEFQSIQKEVKEHDLSVSEQTQIGMLQLLIIKHFTHFKNDMPSTLLSTDKNDNLLFWLEKFNETGLLTILMDEMFLPAEIQKVFKNLTDFISKSIVHIDLENEINRKVENLKFKNKEVFDQIGKVNSFQQPLN